MIPCSLLVPAGCTEARPLLVLLQLILRTKTLYLKTLVRRMLLRIHSHNVGTPLERALRFLLDGHRVFLRAELNSFRAGTMYALIEI